MLRLPLYPLFRLLAVLVVVAAVGTVIVQRLPPQDSPFAPLGLEQPIGLATKWKLRGLKGERDACAAALDTPALSVIWLADREVGPFCSLTDVVAIERSEVRWSAPISITCPMAAALAIWERQVVAPAAARHFGSRVIRIDHFGTYACRRVAGSSSASPRASQHATANAIDVAAFHLADGTRITVAGDWSGEAKKRAFLRDVRDGSCRLFATVLGPDYNAAHADHFHFDMGPYTICR